MVLAVVSAICAGLLLIGATYIVFPSQTPQTPPPMPIPMSLDPFFSAVFWMGLAVSIAIISSVAVMIIAQLKRKYFGRQYTINEEPLG